MKRILSIILMPVALTSCVEVLSEQAVGDGEVDASAFAGSWLSADGEEGALRIRPVAGERGLLTMTDGDTLTEIELRQKHGWHFANHVVAGEGFAGFAWYRVEMAPDEQCFRVWRPSSSAFEALIVAGTVRGRLPGERVAAPGNRQPATGNRQTMPPTS
jgi:hypothetical protein